MSHFKKADPKLYRAALEIKLEEIAPTDNLFRDIVWTITGQQLSGIAADTIFFRLEKLLKDERITPEGLLALSEAHMRSAGVSGAKYRAIRAFSEAVENGSVDLAHLERSSDEEIRQELTKVKGIGPWTVEMILIFSLNRPDVFSPGDLGLRRGINTLYRFRKPPAKKRIEKISASWSPYRSYAARILWRLSDKKTGRNGRQKTKK